MVRQPFGAACSQFHRLAASRRPESCAFAGRKTAAGFSMFAVFWCPHAPPATMNENQQALSNHQNQTPEKPP
jgi:hypothetical protein